MNYARDATKMEEQYDWVTQEFVAHKCSESMKRRAMMRVSNLEQELQLQLELAKIHDYEREYKFLDDRRFRFDFAWPNYDQMLAVEVEGGTWSNGRHTRGAGFAKDCEKYNEAALNGWHVIRVTRDHVKSGQALLWIERFFLER